MIETAADCGQFLRENAEGDLFLHVIPTDEGRHSAASTPSILFIRNVKTGKTYYIALCHPDSVPDFPLRRFLVEGIIKNPNRKWALDKKAICHLIGFPDVLDINLVSYLKHNEILECGEYDTPAHFMVRKHAMGRSQINMVIPLLKHKEMFDSLADDASNLVTAELDPGFTEFNDTIIGTLGRIEKQGIFVDREMFKARFGHEVGESGLTYSQYNVYTSTGRPSNRFGGVNYAALNVEDGTRKCFRSRFGNDGRMVVIDFTAFHPRIVAHLTKYNLSTDVDIYAYLAKLYFRKKAVDETDIKESKGLTFRQLFGGVEDKYAHIKYLANLKTYIDTQWAFFQNNGYVETPIFKRRITTKHIQDPNPPKVFNYILQAVEGEISIPKVKAVLDYLQTKKTKAVLYTYDAVLYDFHRGDGQETLNEIRRIMSCEGMFPMKTYIGETYHDVVQVSL
jgi:hypothetical protein